jgi:hypothetical protein
MFWLAATAVASIYSGVQANKQAKKQASLLSEEGLLAQTDYEKQAVLALDEGYRTRAQQTMDFVSAGVEMIGTPLLVLAETAKMAETDAEELRTTGRNTRNLYNQKAKIAVSEGRASLISSVLTGASALAKG